MVWWCLPHCGGATLGLLKPFEYFVTINHSGLWQKHVAWAKPDGKELRNYISSQYSTDMVLLSLLLGIQNNVFFNSTPEMVELRQILKTRCDVNLFSFNNSEEFTTFENPQRISVFLSLKFWIGFFLLLNICVTIMGILATFTTWSMISAISDRNAHCLLRSSMGQYVTTLSPRLVVVSVYLFLLWFLLFAIDIVALSNPLLWVLLVGVSVLFLSIVVPLSVFGRLILHTGAMAQRPVLSEELEKELLPNGLHASLVIRAHHRQRKNTSVTNQYRRHQQKQQDNDPCNAGFEGDSNYCRGSRHTGSDYLSNPDETMFASCERIGRSLVNREANQNSLLGDQTDGSIVKLPPTGHERQRTNRGVSFAVSGPSLSLSLRERPQSYSNLRLDTNDAAINLPPAIVLNMTMTGKEFQELIDSAIESESPTFESDDMDEEVDGRSHKLTPSSPPHSFGAPPPYSTIHTSSIARAQPPPPRANRQHIRRASSAGVLMQEWAQQGDSIRDI
ncbi:hypothetical protein IV203_020677 [Nitzschia inconspicua]|uniref:Uncharacterized protein n=1 Tax=Nitzschia inconspicua TaxID=303405 RepID=A0A9K3PCQ3_9STRA|nr:hypothetical protein IV203_020677 [Nitzschia inconspicua]